MSVYTHSGPVLEKELGYDSDRIDRRLVRVALRYRADWTGVRWNVYYRLTYRVHGEPFAFEVKLGRYSKLTTDDEKATLQNEAEKLDKRIKDLCEELNLEVRGGATHG